MTCIVGIRHGRTVFIGGDSAGTSGDGSQRIIADSKVFVVQRHFAFGVCGSPKVMQTLRDSTEFPPRLAIQNAQSFITNEVIPEIKRALVEADCFKNDKFEGELLMGYMGGLYRIQSNLQVIAAPAFDATGSGGDIAMGSLHSTSGDPKKRILAALKASSSANATVRPPYNIVSVTSKGV